MSEKPYRPANGIEGILFQDRFCNRCVHDYDYIHNDIGEGCDIVLDSMLYDIEEPEYPKELVQDEKGPRCKKFTQVE